MSFIKVSVKCQKIFRISVSLKNKKKCYKNLRVDFSKCFKKCEGMDIISYNKEELNSNLAMTVSKLHKERYNSEFFINPALTRYISKLRSQYDSFKGTYKFPSKYKGFL